MMRSSLFPVVVLLTWATVLLLPCSNAQPECFSGTISVPPLEGFSLSKVVPKWWYIQEIFFRRPEEIVQPRGSCVQQHTQLFFDDQLTSLREDYTNLTTGDYERKSLYVFSFYPETPAILGLLYSSTSPDYAYQATYVFSDYETYAVMHYCSHQGQAEFPGEHVVVMTGSTEPSETLLGELKGMVASLGFPTENSVKVITDNCTYCWESEDCPYYDTPYYDEPEGGKVEETDF